MPQPQRHSMHIPEEYFRNVSPLCRRIMDEMGAVREAYGPEWVNLSYEEQCKILDQTIVDEATFRKYEGPKPSKLDCEYFPKLKLVTGQKIISDEKLTARGYTCSWRDEHSGPFSWHTRSQMNLNLETPPPTPTQTSDNSQDITPEEKKIQRETFTFPPSYTTNPFHWHYEPRDVKIEPPDLVVASLSNAQSSDTLITRSNSYNHLVVRDDKKHNWNWMRGVINLLSGSCIPLQSCVATKTQLHPSSPFIHPELRPPHVIAKAAKVSLPVINQPNQPRSTSKDSNLKTEASSIDTAITVCEEEPKKNYVPDLPQLPGINIKLLAEEASMKAKVKNNLKSVNTLNKADSKSFNDSEKGPTKLNSYTKKSEEKYDFDEINEEVEIYSVLNEQTQAPIPKTGFDFLDNW